MNARGAFFCQKHISAALKHFSRYFHMLLGTLLLFYSRPVKLKI